MEYYFEYKFTKDEVEALKNLEETLPSSPGQEVIQDIISQVNIDGYRADKS